ncbi:MAG: hypothetical protein V4587_00290 [Acidobacteriota bacterium]
MTNYRELEFKRSECERLAEANRVLITENAKLLQQVNSITQGSFGATQVMAKENASLRSANELLSAALERATHAKTQRRQEEESKETKRVVAVRPASWGKADNEN